MLAHVDGADLFYDSSGDGVPMLLMHGVGLDHAYLRPAHAALADAYRVTSYDHRLNGRSSRTGAADHASWTADAAALLDHLGAARAVIVGHSYGSWLALRFALGYPERVHGLVLSGTAPAFDYLPEVIANAQARDPGRAARLLEGFSTPPASDEALGRVWADVLPLYFHGTPPPDLLAETRFSAVGFAAGMTALAGFDLAPRLAEVHAPVLVVAGRDDFIMPPVQARRVAEGVHTGTYVELAAAGHFPFVEQPTAYRAAIRSWAKEARIA